jgi:hypothetical protein
MWDNIPMKQQQQHTLARSRTTRAWPSKTTSILDLTTTKNKLTHRNAATRTTQFREIHTIENQTMQDLANK